MGTNKTNTLAPLIMVDGPDGIGKSTNVAWLCAALENEGQRVVSTRLLGGTPIGEALREIVLSDMVRPAQTNLYCMLAAYYALADEVARLRAAGHTVVVDRSPLSLLAYQVYGDGIAESVGYALCDELLELFKPSLLILYEASEASLVARRGRADYFENQDAAYHQRTVDGYRKAITRYQADTINADGSVEEIHAATMELLVQRHLL